MMVRAAAARPRLLLLLAACAALAAAPAARAATCAACTGVVSHEWLESVVKPGVMQTFFNMGDLAKALGGAVRAAFHDVGAFTKATNEGRPNGCFLLDDPGNNGLAPYVRNISQYYAEMPAVDGFSKADLIQYAGLVALEHSHKIALSLFPGVPDIPELYANFRVGRVDAPNCPTGWVTSADNNPMVEPERLQLPAPVGGFDHIRDTMINRAGIPVADVVALMGAHTLGSLTKNGAGFQGQWVQQNNALDNDFYSTILDRSWSRIRFNDLPQWEDPQRSSIAMLNTDLTLAYQVRLNFDGCSSINTGASNDCLDNDAAGARADQIESRRLMEEFAGGPTRNRTLGLSRWYSAFVPAFLRMGEMGYTAAELVEPCDLPARCDDPEPTARPTPEPTTKSPTSRPTSRPSESPSPSPTLRPTAKPSNAPSASPSPQPSNAPVQVGDDDDDDDDDSPTVAPTTPPDLGDLNLTSRVDITLMLNDTFRATYHESDEFKAVVRDKVAAALEILVNQVSVNSVRAGSVLVDFSLALDQEKNKRAILVIRNDRTLRSMLVESFEPIVTAGLVGPLQLVRVRSATSEEIPTKEAALVGPYQSLHIDRSATLLGTCVTAIVIVLLSTCVLCCDFEDTLDDVENKEKEVKKMRAQDRLADIATQSFSTQAVELSYARPEYSMDGNSEGELSDDDGASRGRRRKRDKHHKKHKRNKHKRSHSRSSHD